MYEVTTVKRFFSGAVQSQDPSKTQEPRRKSQEAIAFSFVHGPTRTHRLLTDGDERDKSISGGVSPMRLET